MTEWKDLPEDVLDVMRSLGNFGPTVRVEDCMIKGYTIDPESGESGKEYLDANDLIEIANACIYVSNWLVERKNFNKNVL